MTEIPEWIKWIVGLLSGGGAGGFGVHTWYKLRLQADEQEFNQSAEYREELRSDIDKLRDRQDEYEKELVESRNKYFEMQENYHMLKIKHDEALKENKRMRKEITALREEISKLRKELGK